VVCLINEIEDSLN